MNYSSATAIAHPNIAFIKYWGNRDDSLRLPANGSISVNLGELTTRTMVTFDPNLPKDVFDLNGSRQVGRSLQRVTDHLNVIRGLRGLSTRAHILSETNIPIATGVASSAAAFAALTIASVRAIGIEMQEKDLSRLARRGSGSACRSIPGGFVEWRKGSSDTDSFAVSIAKPDYWDLLDCIVILDQTPKKTGSTEGHSLAKTSPIQDVRVSDSDRRLDRCKRAILGKDFELLAEIIEQDTLLMHAVMMTSTPPIYYWSPKTYEIIQSVTAWRKAGLSCAFSIDAGPNVHVICESGSSEKVNKKLTTIHGVVEVIVAHPGGPAHLV